MTVPRGEIVKEGEVGVYHCIARCVRRAFLCGFDKLLGRCFEHRREWIRDRLSFLLEVFAIELLAYAIMSNHLHTLIRNRPDIVRGWSDREVAIRWRKLFPLRREEGEPCEPNEAEIEEIISNATLVSKYRKRLSSVSWFNRCLNERIAKLANAEDECTGRFWEGRFKCQRVEDISAILACSTYVDLNPIRANIAKTPEQSNYTSVQDRIRETGTKVPVKYKSYPRLVSMEDMSKGRLSVKEYLTLVDETGRLLRRGKGSIPAEIKPLLVRLKINPDSWLETNKNYRSLFRRVVGPAKSLRLAAAEIGKAWLHGIRAAQAVFV